MPDFQSDTSRAAPCNVTTACNDVQYHLKTCRAPLGHDPNVSMLWLSVVPVTTEHSTNVGGRSCVRMCMCSTTVGCEPRVRSVECGASCSVRNVVVYLAPMCVIASYTHTYASLFAAHINPVAASVRTNAPWSYVVPTFVVPPRAHALANGPRRTVPAPRHPSPVHHACDHPIRVEPVRGGHAETIAGSK